MGWGLEESRGGLNINSSLGLGVGTREAITAANADAWVEINYRITRTP